MRKHIITLLILLMAALPVWSASAVCHHVQQKAMPQMMMQADGHDCCLDMQKQQTNHHAADTCHCDQFQHGQFVLGLPVILVAVPTNRLIPSVLPLQSLPERADAPYRPPIA
ncbi:MAG: hypothetical protein PHE17_20695 [Thiothrix sp.]|uniref:hypothetical protein n=1 Tax=Thiothrix sp. TaxID=1032 RepID=UPI002639B259|nr:hypothetical protein [Thiothrix sp.]MDD5395450.1 hypothetical protein [Thiothrix sp.]